MEEEKRKGKNKMVIGSAAFMFIYLDSSSWNMENGKWKMENEK
jgi:hypothetical protein